MGKICSSSTAMQFTHSNEAIPADEMTLAQVNNSCGSHFSQEANEFDSFLRVEDRLDS
jgi:hypothetical protein